MTRMTFPYIVDMDKNRISLECYQGVHETNSQKAVHYAIGHLGGQFADWKYTPVLRLAGKTTQWSCT